MFLVTKLARYILHKKKQFDSWSLNAMFSYDAFTNVDLIRLFYLYILSIYKSKCVQVRRLSPNFTVKKAHETPSKLLISFGAARS